jgi:sulfoxide reductase heme-binding subunit YedZ
MARFNRWWILKPAVFLACLWPVGWLTWAFLYDGFSANPVSDITNTTGDWTLRFLMITLSLTPLRRITGWNSLIRFRRMTGLFAFFYSCLHFTTYIWLDQYFAVGEMIKDIAKRPFITVGFTAFVLMMPLAVTSTNKWIRRLGGKRWQRIHRLVYVSATAGVVHYLWLVKLDITRPLTYGAILATLLGLRVWYTLRARVPVIAASPGSSLSGTRSQRSSESAGH